MTRNFPRPGGSASCPAVGSQAAQLLGTVLDHAQQVPQDGDAVVAGVEHLQCPVQDRLLAVGGRGTAHDRDQRGDHCVRAPVGVGEHLSGLLLEARRAQPLGGPERLAGVQHVDVALATAQGDDLAAEGADEVDVVGLEVTEDQGMRAGERYRAVLSSTYVLGDGIPRLAVHQQTPVP